MPWPTGDFILPEPTEAQARYLEGAAAGKITRLPTEDEKIGLYDDTAITAHRRYLPDFITRYADEPLEGVFRKGERKDQ